MKRAYVILFFGWIFCVSAFSGERGIILCDPGSDYIPAWAAPGKPHVVEHLKCGQMVNVIEVGSFVSPLQYSVRPSEFAKIYLGGNEAYVDAKYVKRSGIQEPLKPNNVENVVAEQPSTREEKEKKKWEFINKENVRLRDEMLLDPIYTNGPSTFTATASNSSEFAISQLHLLVRIYDCSSKPKSDYSNCEIIGEVKSFIDSSIPSGQTRRVTGSAMFEATPRVRGTFTWSYRILGVRVE